jgi:pimeloyl-ACP methyl ester carboxylesterase
MFTRNVLSGAIHSAFVRWASVTQYQLHTNTTGSGPTLVLVHGVAGSSKIWQPVIAELARHFTVVAVDLLGYGSSPKPKIDYTLSEHVESLHYTLHNSGISAPFAVAGLSMGTLLVLEYARRWPEDVTRLLCIGMPYYSSETQARTHLRHSLSARLVLERPVLGHIMIQGTWRVAKHSPLVAGMMGRPYSPAMAQDSARVTHRAFSSTLVNCLVKTRPAPLLDATSSIRQWYLHGDQDRYSSLQSIEQALAKRTNCNLSVLPGVAHNTVILAPTDTAAWMLRSLEVAA